MSRSVSAPSSVTKTSPCWNGLIVPGSTLRYGSNFCSWTRRPRAFSRRPSEAATMPFPSAETTPPVTKTYFGARALTGFQGSRGGGWGSASDRRGARAAGRLARLHELAQEWSLVRDELLQGRVADVDVAVHQQVLAAAEQEEREVEGGRNPEPARRGDAEMCPDGDDAAAGTEREPVDPGERDPAAGYLRQLREEAADRLVADRRGVPVAFGHRRGLEDGRAAGDRLAVTLLRRHAVLVPSVRPAADRVPRKVAPRRAVLQRRRQRGGPARQLLPGARLRKLRPGEDAQPGDALVGRRVGRALARAGAGERDDRQGEGRRHEQGGTPTHARPSGAANGAARAPA